jgi:hypothetical protein
MTVTYVGSTFDVKDQWGPQETRLVESTIEQINRKFANESNLLINMTWFGPQYNNNLYTKILKFIDGKIHFDNLFWLSSVDPMCVTQDQMVEIEQRLGVNSVYCVGGFDRSPFEFNFSSTATAEDFTDYTIEQLTLKEIDNVFLCYNNNSISSLQQLSIFQHCDLIFNFLANVRLC